MNEEIGNILLELLSSIPPVEHGQFFDDGRRWCHGCMIPRPFDRNTERTSWKDRCCSVCSALWPEYIEEFVHDVQNDEIDEIELISIH